MGEVYRARDTRLGRHVAVKVLTATFAGDRDRLRRFEREARAVAALNHPNILAIHDVGTQPDATPYLVSELLEGESLRQRLQRGPLSARKAIEYGIQIAQGLSAAHDKGIAHRDLKPENLFLTKDGHVKILDFGLATLPEVAAGAETIEAAVETMAGTVLGTVGYMSPEQVRGEVADHRSDVFSLGTVLYEMFTGRRAFARPTSVETMNAILKDEPPANPARCRARASRRPANSGSLPGEGAGTAVSVGARPGVRVGRAFRSIEQRSHGDRSFVDSPFGSTRTYWLVPVAGSGHRRGHLRCGHDVRRQTQPARSQLARLAAHGVSRDWSLSLRSRPMATTWRSSGTVVFPDARICTFGSSTAESRCSSPATRFPRVAPTWSPDGKRIAFLRGPAAVYVIPLLGGTERKLVQLSSLSPAGAGAPQLSWSPDGQFIAVHGSAQEGEPAGTFLIPTEGGEPTRLTLLPAGFDGEGLSGIFSGRHTPRLRSVPQPLQCHDFRAVAESGRDGPGRSCSA